mgnify:CR=1 FL=1
MLTKQDIRVGDRIRVTQEFEGTVVFPYPISTDEGLNPPATIKKGEQGVVRNLYSGYAGSVVAQFFLGKEAPREGDSWSTFETPLTCIEVV